MLDHSLHLINKFYMMFSFSQSISPPPSLSDPVNISTPGTHSSDVTTSISTPSLEHPPPPNTSTPQTTEVLPSSTNQQPVRITLMEKGLTALTIL